MSIILKYIKQIWTVLLLLLILTVIATIATTARPMAAAGIINLTLQQIGYESQPEQVTQDINQEFSIFNLNRIGSEVTDYIFSVFDINGDIEDAIPYFIFILLILSVLASTIKFSGHLINALTRSRIMKRLRLDLTESLLNLSLTFYNNKKSGELISRIVTDAQLVGQGVVSACHRILHSFLLIVVYFIFLVNTNINLTIGICLIVIAHYILTAFIKNPVKKYEKQNIESIAALSASLQEIFANIRLIKTYSAARYTTDNLEKNISQSSKAYFNTQAISSLEVEMRYLLDGLAEGLILFVSILQLFSGTITIEGFLLYIYVSRLMLGPINEFSTYFVWLQRIIASSSRIEEYSNLKSDIKEGKQDVVRFEDKIEIKNLTFSYTNKKILNDINFQINKNEVIAIVGQSGSGKSTLLDLILRFYDPDNGHILIDSKNIKKFKTSSYRQLFGVVSQDILLLNDTILNNIDYGRGYSEKSIKKAATDAFANEFIDSMKYGYDTVIGDRGVKLSGGQRQRLSIARAIVGNPHILVLDEATSALDSESELLVQNGINDALKSRTAVIVAHRLSTIMRADKILLLNNGKIDAMGKHEELLKNSIHYGKLYDKKHD